MFNLENKLVKSCLLSEDGNKSLALNFVVGLTHLSNQEVEHDDQHEEEIYEPERPNNEYCVRLCC
jgi:hypothetical protein